MCTYTHFEAAIVRRLTSLLCATVVAVLALAPNASAQSADDFMCDNSFQDCRSAIIQLIRQENVGIDVSFWFMTDTRYSSEIIARWRAGVPVRIILDTDADTNYPSNANVRQAFISAGIPLRNKVTPGINHWKMMLYAGQGKVHFSAANFANGSYSPVVPYTRYVDEAVYFTNDPAVVHSFMTRFDDLWIDTTHHQNLANVNGPLTRNYPIYPIDSAMNFPPDTDYQDRVVSALRQEPAQIDVAMFRITSAKVPDEMIRRRQAGLAVRLITDQDQYRNPTYMWHSYNVDRMYLAGISIKWKIDEGTIDEDMHQKSIVLPNVPMAIFGSSNWTSSSSDKQREHNYFTRKQWIVDWFVAQFHRKWNNLTVEGTPIGTTMFQDFVPGWPETPANVSPANAALGVATSIPLRWEGGWWAHKYDIYFGTTNPPPLIASNYMPGSATAGVSSTKESFNPCTPPSGFTSVCPGGLQPGTTYYWRIRGKTMLGDLRAINGQVWSFTTSGGVPPPPTPTGLTATAVSATQINLSWTDVAGESGYKVERKLASSSTWTQIGTAAANAVTYGDGTGLTANTQYNYRIRAWTSGGNSGYSNTATATTLATSPETARVWDDAYVRAGTSAGTNFGRASELVVKNGTDTTYVRETYFKLDISSMQATDNVRLRLFGRLSDTRAATVAVGVYPVASTTWAETTLTWNNRPAFTTGILDSIAVGGTTGAWYELNLTSYAQQQRAAGQSVISVVLRGNADSLPYVTFGSRESGNAPRLLIFGSTANGAARILSDSYVRAGNSSNTNYGAATDLVAKQSGDPQYLREAFMRLDISDVQPDSDVTLRLFGRLSDAREGTVRTDIYPVADTGWDESSITWDNRPTVSASPAASVVVAGTATQAYDIDLTTLAHEQRTAGSTVLGIALKNQLDSLPYVAFWSRESEFRPELIIQ